MTIASAISWARETRANVRTNIAIMVSIKLKPPLLWSCIVLALRVLVCSVVSHGRRAPTHTLFRVPLAQAGVEFPQLDPAGHRYGHRVIGGAVAQVDDVGAGRHCRVSISNWDAAAVEDDE